MGFARACNQWQIVFECVFSVVWSFLIETSFLLHFNGIFHYEVPLQGAVPQLPKQANLCSWDIFSEHLLRHLHDGPIVFSSTALPFLDTYFLPKFLRHLRLTSVHSFGRLFRFLVVFGVSLQSLEFDTVGELVVLSDAEEIAEKLSSCSGQKSLSQME